MDWYMPTNITSLWSTTARGGLWQISWDPPVIESVLDIYSALNLSVIKKANWSDLATAVSISI